MGKSTFSIFSRANRILFDPPSVACCHGHCCPFSFWIWIFSTNMQLFHSYFSKERALGCTVHIFRALWHELLVFSCLALLRCHWIWCCLLLIMIEAVIVINALLSPNHQPCDWDVPQTLPWVTLEVFSWMWVIVCRLGEQINVHGIICSSWWGRKKKGALYLHSLDTSNSTSAVVRGVHRGPLLFWKALFVVLKRRRKEATADVWAAV